MAILAKHPEGPHATLLSRHLVGRSRLADLQMTEPTVSGEHAVLRWTGREWELHDLGSRNGTLVEGRRLAPGERVALARGAPIAFGDAANTWRLIDDAPPTLMAVPDDGGEPVCARDELLVRVGGRDFVLRVPDLIAPTWDGGSPAPHLAVLTLRFSVSRDEEYVALEARDERRAIDLGARAHHQVLLALARSRLEDRRARAAEAGGRGAPPESSEGWVYQDDLAATLAMDETHLNVAVFRCRRQLAEAGIAGAASIIERRRSTRELRLGVARIEIVTV